MTYHFLLFLLVIPISGFYIKDPSWQIWKNTYQKTYVNEDEEKLRYAVWENNMKKITDFNQLNKGFELAMNQYGDLTHDEFTFRMKGYLGKSVYNNTSLGSSFLKPLGVSYPKEVDWREHGYVTPVKDQSSPHRCGSCWAFSATGSLEGQHFRKTGKLVSLSEQNLIDCSRKYGNHGCHGGLMDRAFRYIKDNGGIDTEENYPYEAVVSVDRGTVAGCSCLNEDGLPCRFKKQTIGATITGYTDIERGNEEELKAAVATVGPVSVAIDASDFFFKFYKNGVYDNEMCSSYHLNHGVLAVGYGTNSNGKDYWIIKNSWGEHWGNKGYILMSRNKHNQCGIATQASYPLV